MQRWIALCVCGVSELLYSWTCVSVVRLPMVHGPAPGMLPGNSQTSAAAMAQQQRQACGVRCMRTIGDAAGLLCLKTAKSGGLSSVASSVTIHNELLKRDPSLVRTLVRCVRCLPGQQCR
jgi:Taurine catabolism dioxygenase TauD, TfdA family